MTPMRTSRAVLAMSDHQAAVTAIEKAEKLLDLRKALQLFLSALARLREIQIRVEEQSIRALQLALHILGDAVALQADLVQPVEADRIPVRLHIGRHVLRNARAPASEA